MNIVNACVTASLGVVLAATGTSAQDRRLEFDRRLVGSTEFGPLYPAFVDFDGDGQIDLVAGTQGTKERKWEGGLLVYRNRGTNSAPLYAKPSWFETAVPTGRIPCG